MKKTLIVILFTLLAASLTQAKPRFKALVFYENKGHHVAYSKAAKIWLDSLALKKNFSIEYVTDTRKFTPDFLKDFQLLIQLDYPPYAWKPEEMEAFKDYMEKGQGGWIGFHHATLLGDFDGYQVWPWFKGFMGDILFKNYIPAFADGEVQVEHPEHAIFKGVGKHFLIKKEEWYTYDKSPRANVSVLAHVDEKSYQPADVPKMGDHPVIWTNNKVTARNVYIFMGHSPDLFQDKNYKRLFANAIFWTVEPYLKK